MRYAILRFLVTFYFQLKGIIMKMTIGANTPVPQETLTVRVTSGVPCDISAFRLYENAKVKGDGDMIFYGQTHSEDQSLSLKTDNTHATFTVVLPNVDAAIHKIAFAATCDAGNTIASLGQLSIQVEQSGNTLLTAEVNTPERLEAALILGELYRRNQEWKFRFVSQGFNGGLKPLSEFFGIEVASEQPAPNKPPTPTPSSPPVSTISLSKVSLTKEKPSISLAKREGYGLVKINLNWNKGEPKKGFFNKVLHRDIDLDLGCFVRLKNGNQDVIQALGKRFGNLNSSPFVYLLGDDRSGQSTSGEWLHINGDYWREIEEVLVYAFIYEGAANWAKTDGIVTMEVPNEPPIETRLTEGGSQKNMCAVGRIINDNGAMRVERLNTYFAGHPPMDQAYGWGFKWGAGSK